MYCYAEKSRTHERSYSRSYSSSYDYEPPKPKTKEEKDAELLLRTKELPKRVPTENDSFSKWILDEGSKIKNGGSIKPIKNGKGNISYFECNVGMLGDLQEVIKTMMELQNHFMSEYNKQKLASWEGWPQNEPVYIVRMKGTYNVPSIRGDYQGRHIANMDIASSEEKEFVQEVVYSSKSAGNMLSQTNTYGNHFEMEDKNSYMLPENKTSGKSKEAYGFSTPEKWLNLVNKGYETSAIAGSRLTAECSRFELLHDNYDKVEDFSDATNILTIQNGYVMIANTQDLIKNIDRDAAVTREDILKSMRTGKGNDKEPSSYENSILYPIQEWKDILPKDADDKIIDTLKDQDIETYEKHEDLMKFILGNSKNQLANTTEFSNDFYNNIIIDSKSQKELDAFLSLKSLQVTNFKKGKTDENTYGYWKGRRFQYLKDKEKLNGLNKEITEIREENEKLKIHYNSKEPEKFGAKAFTKDGEIHLASGQENSLEHELGHVIQQQSGKVKPTGKINGHKVNADPKLEKEADKIGKNEIKDLTNSEIKTKGVIQFDDFDVENPGRTQEKRRDYYRPRRLVQQGISKVEDDIKFIDECEDIESVEIALRAILSQYWANDETEFEGTPPICSLKGMNLDLAKANAKQITYLLSKYSTSIHDITVGEARGMYNGQPVVGRAGVSNGFESTGGRTLTFTKAFFESEIGAYAGGERSQIEWGKHAEVRTREEMKKRGQSKEAQISEIEKLLKYTVTHEFGHSILSYAALSSNLITETQENIEFCVTKLYNKYKGKNLKQDDEGFISDYATTTKEEFIAESFVQFELSSNPESASKYAQKLMEIINTFFAWNPKVKPEEFDWKTFKASLNTF